MASPRHDTIGTGPIDIAVVPPLVIGYRLLAIGYWLLNERVCERICGLKRSQIPDGCSMASAHSMSRKLIAVLHRIPSHHILIDLDAESRPIGKCRHALDDREPLDGQQLIERCLLHAILQERGIRHRP